MNEEQIEVVYELLKTFQDINLNQYIIVIGSWAEYFYTTYLGENFHPEIATRDIDILYPDIHTPRFKIDLVPRLRTLGFIYSEDLLSGSAKFYKGNLLELEFLTRVIGPDKVTNEIKSIGITAESVREIKILSDYFVPILWRGIYVNIPEPAAYILHKILINPKRKKSGKQEKDIRSIKNLIRYIQNYPYQINLGKDIYKNLTIKQKRTFEDVCIINNIDLNIFI